MKTGYWIIVCLVFFGLGYWLRGAKEFRRWLQAKADNKLDSLWKGK